MSGGFFQNTNISADTLKQSVENAGDGGALKKVLSDAAKEVREREASPVASAPAKSMQSPKEENSTQAKRSTGAFVVPKGAVIGGDVTYQGDLLVRGNIHGSVCADKVVIETKVFGDVRAGQCGIASGGVVVGNICAGNIRVAGAVKGNLSADQAIMCEDTCQILGNLNGKKITISPSAAIRGECRFDTPLSEDIFQEGVEE